MSAARGHGRLFSAILLASGPPSGPLLSVCAHEGDECRDGEALGIAGRAPLVLAEPNTDSRDGRMTACACEKESLGEGRVAVPRAPAEPNAGARAEAGEGHGPENNAGRGAGGWCQWAAR